MKIHPNCKFFCKISNFQLIKGKNTRVKKRKFTHNWVEWNENLLDPDYDAQAFCSSIAPLLLSKNASRRVLRQRHERRKGVIRAWCQIARFLEFKFNLSATKPQNHEGVDGFNGRRRKVRVRKEERERWSGWELSLGPWDVGVE